MAYRYTLTRACARDVEDLARERRYPPLCSFSSRTSPRSAPLPRGAGEPKKGILRGCYGFARAVGAAYRPIYEVRDDVILRGIGAHDAAYRDAERRRR